MQYHECACCHQIVPQVTPLCMRCGADFSPQPDDNVLRDVVTRYRLNSTEIWIFPTCIFGDRGMAYWLQDRNEGGRYPFMEILCPDDEEHGHYQGQLCDALVDSANNFLIAGSGLARHLDEQFGEHYRQRKREVLDENHGELVHGQAYFLPLSSPCRRVLKGVIEAISIRYSRGAGGALRRIPSNDTHVRASVLDALRRAHDQACRSVAMPQMASRPGYSIYGPAVAPAVMVAASLNAIVTFLSEVTSTSLQRICLHPADLAAEEQMVLFFNRLSG